MLRFDIRPSSETAEKKRGITSGSVGPEGMKTWTNLFFVNALQSCLSHVFVSASPSPSPPDSSSDL